MSGALMAVSGALMAVVDAAMLAQRRAADAREELAVYDLALSCDVLSDHRGARWGFNPDDGNAADVLWALDDAGQLEELVTGLAVETDFDVYTHDELTFASVYDLEQLTTLYVFTTALRELEAHPTEAGAQ